MLKDFSTPEGVDAWVRSLDDRWPERQAIRGHIARLIAQLPAEEPRLLELAPGSGPLAQALVEQVPGLDYTGVDNSLPLLARARARLAKYSQQVTLVVADLNEEGWVNQLDGPFDAVVSMQSLHDLGSAEQIERVYYLCRPLLAPGGVLLNADFVVSPGEEDPDKPGRLTVDRHMELLAAYGYEDGRCTLQEGQLACCQGSVP